MRKTNTDVSALFYDLWFPRNTQDITIIASPSYEDLKDAKLTSPNYALLDRLGDRDSIFSIGKLLSRKYPRAIISLLSSKDYNNYSLSKNSVVIGGPGGCNINAINGLTEDFEGNEVCKIFSKKINSQISYSNDCESLHYNNSDYVSTYDYKGHMTADYGYFASFPNPFMRNNKIILLHGIHTLGVVGATRLFDGEYDSCDNFRHLKSHFTSRLFDGIPAFECFFKVEVANGEVTCPEFENLQILTLFEKQAIHPLVLSGIGDEKKTTFLDESSLKNRIMTLIWTAHETSNLEAKKIRLVQLQTEVNKISEFDSLKFNKIIKIIEQNTKFPDENINSILELLKS